VRFAIRSREEAQAYLAHPVLGPRLRELTCIVNRLEGRSLHEIFGSPDDLKFRSCMTLFSQVAPENREFLEALDKYSASRPDPLTLVRL